uniref:U55-Sparatoxin-Hju1c_1 n=1 Tax=Heteropoda jugulans TaxID=1358901 RepID=A0A4Q8K458_9ARAC
MYKVILLLLVVVSVTFAQEECQPDFCSRARCAAATECPDGQTLKERDEARCRCCDYCAIQEGESCENMSTTIYLTVCDDGLVCDEQTKVCRPEQ